MNSFFVKIYAPLEWLCVFIFRMFCRIYFPPEFLTKMLRSRAYALQVVEIIGGDTLKYFSHTTHGEHGEIIVGSGVVQMTLKEAHELAPLGFLCFFKRRGVFG